jgi:hypothetical protein
MSTKPIDPNPAPSLPALNVTAAQLLNSRSRYLPGLIGIYNGIAKQNAGFLFPSDLPPATVRDHIQNHLATEAAHQSAGQQERAAVAKRNALHKQAEALLSRLESLVGGNFPAGSPQRIDFFVRSSAPSLLSERLAAMVAGIKAHNLQPLPANWPLPAIEALTQQTAEAEQVRETVVTTRKGAATEREHLEVTTASMAQRLRKVLEGYYGSKSPELGQFGLLARKVSHGGGRKKKASDTPAPADGPTPAPI